MLIKNPKFEISAMNKSQYPKGRMPEIVLAGKSNVGKSSFVNSLTNRKVLLEPVALLVKQDNLTFIIWMIDFTLLICLDMAILKCLRPSKKGCRLN